MTAADRQRVRQQLDARARARIEAADEARCAGCGTALENKTIGCKKCCDRHNRQRKREDPAYRARAQQRQREIRKSRAKIPMTSLQG